MHPVISAAREGVQLLLDLSREGIQGRLVVARREHADEEPTRVAERSDREALAAEERDHGGDRAELGVQETKSAARTRDRRHG